MKITIPACQEHQGIFSMIAEISDFCPVCGEKRGEPKPGLSFDGSRRLDVDIWNNPCGHVDYYNKVREEHFRLKGGAKPATGPIPDKK